MGQCQAPGSLLLLLLWGHAAPVGPQDRISPVLAGQDSSHHFNVGSGWRWPHKSPTERCVQQEDAKGFHFLQVPPAPCQGGHLQTSLGHKNKPAGCSGAPQLLCKHNKGLFLDVSGESWKRKGAIKK